jgi:hypothetical protein
MSDPDIGVSDPAMEAGVDGRGVLLFLPLRLGSRNRDWGRDLEEVRVGILLSSSLAGTSAVSRRHWLRKGSWKCISISLGGGVLEEVKGAVPRM